MKKSASIRVYGNSTREISLLRGASAQLWRAAPAMRIVRRHLADAESPPRKETPSNLGTTV